MPTKQTEMQLFTATKIYLTQLQSKFIPTYIVGLTPRYSECVLLLLLINATLNCMVYMHLCWNNTYTSNGKLSDVFVKIKINVFTFSNISSLLIPMKWPDRKSQLPQAQQFGWFVNTYNKANSH